MARTILVEGKKGTFLLNYTEIGLMVSIVWERLRLVTVAVPGLFSYLFMTRRFFFSFGCYGNQNPAWFPNPYIF